MATREFGELMIRHRKSAIFFERIAEPGEVQMYEPIIQWGLGKETIKGEPEPHYKRNQLDVGYQFTEEEVVELLAYLKSIAQEAWPSFESREIDSSSSDYDSYWDRDIQDEGNLSVWFKNRIMTFKFSAPFQPVKANNLVRLYKFNKLKFQGLIFDLEKMLQQAVAK